MSLLDTCSKFSFECFGPPAGTMSDLPVHSHNQHGLVGNQKDMYRYRLDAFEFLHVTGKTIANMAAEPSLADFKHARPTSFFEKEGASMLPSGSADAVCVRLP